MGSKEIVERVVKGRVYDCDSCGKRIKYEEIGYQNSDRNLCFCVKCKDKIPNEVLSYLSVNRNAKIKDEWKIGASEYVYSCLDNISDYLGDEVPEYEDIPDLNKGIWSFYSTQNDAEHFEVRYHDDISEIEEAAYDMEYRQRNWPLYLGAILADGKLRKFKIVRKLEIE